MNAGVRIEVREGETVGAGKGLKGKEGEGCLCKELRFAPHVAFGRISASNLK